MYHGGNLFSDFENWYGRHENKYEKLSVSESEFQEFPFKKGFNKGDILFIIGAKPEKIKLGDVIIFQANQRNPIIHRVIKISEKNGQFIFSTIGDNNPGQLNFETQISEDAIVGKAVFRLAPYIGWGKLIFFEGQKSSYERGFCEEN
jgi:hypothetical protein